MVLAVPIFDLGGHMVLESGTKLNNSNIPTIAVHGLEQVVIEDWRVADVPVRPYVAPEVEAGARHVLRQLLDESRFAGAIDPALLDELTEPIYAMARAFFPESVGEMYGTGCLTVEDYNYVQPAKVAGLAMLIGKRLGMKLLEVADLGIAALAKDIGYALMPGEYTESCDPTYTPSPDAQSKQIWRHVVLGAEALDGHPRFSLSVVQAVRQHHERWDGSGYPSWLKGTEISLPARILAVADTYYELVSRRPYREPWLPHEAVECIMAFGGQLFDPEIVEVFSRQVSLYPAGLAVGLSTGEVGIISEPNVGHVGRPVVRICYDNTGTAQPRPYDLDLSEPENQGKLVVRMLEQ